MKLAKILYDLAFQGHTDGSPSCGRHQTLADRRRLLPSSHPHERVVTSPKPDFHGLRPLPGAPKMSEETTLTGSQGIPFTTVGGPGAVERAGLRDQHKGIIQVRAASDA